MAIDLKKKLGPLPVWAWAVAGAGTIGIVYYFHSKSSSSTSSTSQTDAELAAEQAAAQNAYGTPYYDTGAGSGTAPATLDTTGLATGSITTDQLDSDIQALGAQIAAVGANAPTDTMPSTTIAAEGQDLLSAQKTLAALGLGGGSLAKGSTPAAKGKSAAGLTILAQLRDLQAGLIGKSQLGNEARAQLNNVGGNVNKAIANRQTALAKAASKKTQRTTPSIANRRA